MAAYYLIAQLPSLDAIADTLPLPITEERFLELCDRLLGKKARSCMQSLTLLPPTEPDPSGSRLIDGWLAGERGLRTSLAQARAARMGMPADTKLPSASEEWDRIAREAVEIESPLEAERFLLRHRLELLEALRPADHFSEDYVYYYCIKLKLLLRMRSFDKQQGEIAYHSIYHSILHGDPTEAVS